MPCRGGCPDRLVDQLIVHVEDISAVHIKAAVMSQTHLSVQLAVGRGGGHADRRQCFLRELGVVVKVSDAVRATVVYLLILSDLFLGHDARLRQ